MLPSYVQLTMHAFGLNHGFIISCKYAVRMFALYVFFLFD
ncbi:putative membrane protein [Synechococcus sp. A15-44]|nr:putative membrane protein [Synechococcus sp. A15-44]